MKVAIIGGPLFYKCWGLNAEVLNIQTPFGFPSDKIYKFKLNDHEIVSLLRHGPGHKFAPTEVPYLANTYALSIHQPDFVIQVNACGSLNDNYQLGAIFLFDQVIDLTNKRPNTFGKKLFPKVQHLDFSQPISQKLNSLAASIFRLNNIVHQEKGTLIVEEGPRFSTTAESRMYKLLGADAINQTACPELYLFRELGIPVVSMSLIVNKILTNATTISIEEISNNIITFEEIIPEAVKLFIEQLPKKMVVTKPVINIFDTSKFIINAGIEITN